MLESCIFVYHFIETQKNDPLKFSKIKQKPSLYASYLLIICGFILLFHTIPFNLSQTYVPTLSECVSLGLTAAPVYMTFKSVLYIVLILRSYQSFGTSSVGYSSTRLIIFGIILIVWNISNVIFNAFTINTSIIDDKCYFELYNPYLYSIILMDMVASGISTYLFVKPVITLNKQIKRIMMNSVTTSSDSEHDNENTIRDTKRLRHVAIKQCILSMIAIGSTMIGAVLTVLFHLHQTWASLDVVISTFCVVLMYKWYSKLTKKLFQMFCCCCSCCEYLQDNKTKTKHQHDHENGRMDHESERTTNTVTSGNECKMGSLEVCKL